MPQKRLLVELSPKGVGKSKSNLFQSYWNRWIVENGKRLSSDAQLSQQQKDNQPMKFKKQH